MSKKEKIVGYLKVGGDLVSTCGAQALACGLVRLVLPPGVHVVAKGGMLLGGMLLGGFIGEKLSDYTENSIDEAVKEFDESMERIRRDLDTLKDKDIKEENEPKNEE